MESVHKHYESQHLVKTLSSTSKLIKRIEGDKCQCEEFDDEIFNHLNEICMTNPKEESIKIDESVYFDAMSQVIANTEYNRDSFTKDPPPKEEVMSLPVPEEKKYKIETNESSVIKFPVNCILK